MFANREAKVLVTGGTRGIGRSLAERFFAAGATVMVTGRDETKLEQARCALPGLRTFKSDIGNPSDRESLARHVAHVMPDISVIINNAGIQRRVALADDHAPWEIRQQEIDILLAGPIHVTSLLLPLMLKSRRRGLVVNVTSGGAYIAQPFAPTYAACKAALHSYTMTLRHALRHSLIHVTELIPPAVATGLAGPGENHGAPVDAFADAVFPRIAAGIETDIGFGPTQSDAFIAGTATYRALFETSAARFPVRGYMDE